MYIHHNPKIAKPIIDVLLLELSKVEDGWLDSTYGNDCRASVEFETLEGDFIRIYVPNATVTDVKAEEFADFMVEFPYGEETVYWKLDTLESVISLFAEGASEAFENVIAIENKL